MSQIVNLLYKKIPYDNLFLMDDPSYGSEGAACFDLQAAVTKEIPAGATVLVPTGLAFQIPRGYKIDVYSRSGLSAKGSLALANGVGIIDSDYRGEVMVALYNRSSETRYVNQGDRIAQAMLVPVPKVCLIPTDVLEATERGDGGFGSTGR